MNKWFVYFMSIPLTFVVALLCQYPLSYIFVGIFNFLAYTGNDFFVYIIMLPVSVTISAIAVILTVGGIYAAIVAFLLFLLKENL